MEAQSSFARINNNNKDGLKKALVTKNKCLVCMTIQLRVRRERSKFRANLAIQIYWNISMAQNITGCVLDTP